MKKHINNLRMCCDDSFNSLYYLESIIKATKESFQYKELITKSLDIEDEMILCINMLTLALDEVSKLKIHLEKLEENIFILN